MALQPSDRPPGSAQVLRFTGVVTLGDALATFPKANGELTTGGAVGDARGARFLLADATDLANMERRLPTHVFDDGAPTGSAPHAPIPTSLVALITNADEEDITAKTWVENLDVDVVGESANIASVDRENCVMVLDTLTSGLGLNTGLPVLIVPFVLSGEQEGSITIDLRLEVRWTAAR